MLRLTLLWAALLLLAACGPPPMTVKLRANPDEDFTSLHSYAWAEQPAPGDTTLRSDALRERVHASVDAALIDKGLAVADATTADVLVYWYAAVHKKAELRKLDYTQSAPLPERTVDVFEQGTLVIDLVERERGVLLWRAEAQARLVPNASEQERKARVQAAVARMFESFPAH